MIDTVTIFSGNSPVSGNSPREPSLDPKLAPVGRSAGTEGPLPSGFDRSRLLSLAPIAVFDLAGPLALYWLLRAAGVREVSALILSGILPALGVAVGFIRHRRVDAIGVLVLFGIVTGTVVGLVSHSARLVLLEGSVPTAVFGLACLGSLLAGRPLMFRIALQTIGVATASGRNLQASWSQPQVRHRFTVITLVWGITYLAEAAARFVIVNAVSTGTALVVVKLMPYLVTAVLINWTRRSRRVGQPPVARDQAGPAAPDMALSN